MRRPYSLCFVSLSISILAFWQVVVSPAPMADPWDDRFGNITSSPHSFLTEPAKTPTVVECGTAVECGTQIQQKKKLKKDYNHGF